MRVAMAFLRLVLVLMACSTAALAVSVHQGIGQPDLSSWCPLDWLASCSSGVAALTQDGLELEATQAPPPSALELSLELMPYRSLLFVLRSEQPIGHVRVLLDQRELQRIKVPQGNWWIQVDDLPARGVLRLELDPHCEKLLIRSVYFPCSVQVWDCRWAFLGGVILGAVVTTLLCLVTR